MFLYRTEILQYTPMIQKYCKQYGILKLVNTVQAIMMQEPEANRKKALPSIKNVL